MNFLFTYIYFTCVSTFLKHTFSINFEKKKKKFKIKLNILYSALKIVVVIKMNKQRFSYRRSTIIINSKRLIGETSECVTVCVRM